MQMIKKSTAPKKTLQILVLALIFGAMLSFFTAFVSVYEVSAFEVNVNFMGTEGEEDEGVTGSATLQILFLTVLIALLPSLLVVTTSFTRLIIIFSFIRSGLGTNQMPPNTVLIGLALILTLFIMNPEFTEINENALAPLTAGEISQTEAIESITETLRDFMLNQRGGMMDQNVMFFADMIDYELVFDGDTGEMMYVEEIPMHIILPAFILHELTTGFAVGVFIFIPFIIIDMVVASVLMAMGMMMLPPAMISLPFKVMMFVLVGGWELLIGMAMATFI